MRSQTLRAASRRVGALRLLLFACFFVLAGRAAWLTVGQVDEAVRQGMRQIHTRIEVAAARGLILDRDGHELAITVRAPSIYVIPEDLDHPEADVDRLAKALGLDAAELRQRVLGRRGFRYVARWVEEETGERVRALDLDGIGVQLEPRRAYPSGALAASVIGFANIDGDGVRGVEQMMDDWLKGNERSVPLLRDARGKKFADRSFDPRLAMGGDVRLSLDAGLQAMAEEALDQAVAETGAKGGLVIVLDPRTGDVLSLAEQPRFDPNDFRANDYASSRSRAFSDAIEPGSTMKALLVAAALDAGAIAPDQAFDTGDGTLRVPGKTIRDHDPYGVLDPAGILQHSSNVGAVMIGEALGPRRWHGALRAFGFGERSGSEFPDESAGILRGWQGWKPVDAATHAYGQGVAVTAMQLASAMAALANGGERMQPRLVVARRAPLGEWEPIAPVSHGHVVSPESARLTLEMMTGVVGPLGTGRLAGLAGVEVAGKTGTAQKVDPKSGRYSDRDYIAWFMAAVPADAPRLAIVVAIDEPKGPAHSGGLVAAPVFARVATDQLADVGIQTRPAPISAAPVPTHLVELRARIEAESEARAEARANEKAEATAQAHRLARASEAAGATPRASSTRRPAAGAKAPSATRALASVAAGPPPGAHAVQVAAAHAPGMRERAVLVPDFMGSEAERATLLAAQEDLDVRLVGHARGLVVAQTPRPGTIISGAERTVQLTLAGPAPSGGTRP